MNKCLDINKSTTLIINNRHESLQNPFNDINVEAANFVDQLPKYLDQISSFFLVEKSLPDDEKIAMIKSLDKYFESVSSLHIDESIIQKIIFESLQQITDNNIEITLANYVFSKISNLRIHALSCLITIFKMIFLEPQNYSFLSRIFQNNDFLLYVIELALDPDPENLIMETERNLLLALSYYIYEIIFQNIFPNATQFIIGNLSISNIIYNVVEIFQNQFCSTQTKTYALQLLIFLLENEDPLIHKPISQLIPESSFEPIQIMLDDLAMNDSCNIFGGQICDLVLIMIQFPDQINNILNRINFMDLYQSLPSIDDAFQNKAIILITTLLKNQSFIQSFLSYFTWDPITKIISDNSRTSSLRDIVFPFIEKVLNIDPSLIFKDKDHKIINQLCSFMAEGSLRDKEESMNLLLIIIDIGNSDLNMLIVQQNFIENAAFFMTSGLYTDKVIHQMYMYAIYAHDHGISEIFDRMREGEVFDNIESIVEEESSEEALLFYNDPRFHSFFE